MADKRITELTEHTVPIDTDLLPVVDMTAGETKKIPLGSLRFTRQLAATGTVDDSNTTFSFTEKPLMININGSLYPEATGIFNWSWSSPNATLAVPVGTGGFIVGLS